MRSAYSASVYSASGLDYSAKRDAIVRMSHGRIRPNSTTRSILALHNHDANASPLVTRSKWETLEMSRRERERRALRGLSRVRLLGPVGPQAAAACSSVISTATVTVAECQPAAPGPGARQAPPLASGGMRDPETASKARFPDCASAPWCGPPRHSPSAPDAGQCRRSQWGSGPGTVAAVGLGQAGGPGRAMPGRARATVTAGQGRSLMGAPASEHPMAG